MRPMIPAMRCSFFRMSAASWAAGRCVMSPWRAGFLAVEVAARLSRVGPERSKKRRFRRDAGVGREHAVGQADDRVEVGFRQKFFP